MVHCVYLRCHSILTFLTPLISKTFSAISTHMMNICGIIKISLVSTEISHHVKQMLRDNKWFYG